ncbi:uncharacterized protein K02A2.6-like [Eublepharis macularius]|uniref:Gypsy retrotransposon integrase-like protein 1 n=1 Tax=Eublepharis macularius TaxID=481883 RepID=A0AA97J2W6_EUBMA|nr:uncharacterized protein K02A2.6-like [Eublepharis macularius]
MATAGHFGPFDLTSEDWESYIARFEFYLEANKLEDAELQRATFFSVCGKTTFEIARALVAPAQLQALAFSEIKDKLRDHFSPQPSEVASHHVFHKQDQAHGESVSNFVTALRKAARKCNFPDLENTLRDRLATVQPKIRVTVQIEGTPCEMEVDSGSALSIISKDLFDRVCTGGRSKRLEPSDLILTDFQGRRVPVAGVGLVKVSYKQFQGPLHVVVVKGRLTSLLGLDWFEALGIHVTGVQQVSQSGIRAVCEEFPGVFDGSLGCYKGPPVSFNLNPAAAPVRLKARRVPFALKPRIDEELDRLIAQGVLEPVSHACWETPIVTPIKANGDVRICADYKCTINKALQQHAYPVPVVSHLLASLAGGRIFAKIDLAQAYQQLPVDEATAEAQTIVTHRGAFKVKRLQFGVSVAPGIFQGLMEGLLRGIPGVIPYFDDVLIAGSTPSELSDRLREVLRCLQDTGLKVKKEKCQFGVPRVEFLGFLIDADGIHPTDSKVQAISQAPPPRSKKELQAFLGLLNFYHAFLPHKASLAEPLHHLLEKNAKWTWDCRHARAFTAVKELLSSEAVLTHFDESKPLILASDASPYGIGAVLSHRMPDGREAPIAYFSRSLSRAERNYAQIDKEALALVAGVKKFHDYVYGRRFEITTDHKPLLGLLAADRQTPQVMSPRMLRWSVFLSAYDYQLSYRPGKAIGHADALSRLPLPEPADDPSPAHGVMQIEDLPQPPLVASDIAAHSAKDPTLSRVLNWVWRGWPAGGAEPELQPFHSRQLELSVHKGCLLWGSRVVVPPKLRQRVLEALHVGHPGIVKMKALARSYVWWPGIDREVEGWVRACQPCQEARPEMPQAPVRAWETTRTPWSRLHIDFAGPFQGHTFLVVVDSYSKWLEVVPVSAMTSGVVIRALRRLIATHGLPDTIVSDNAAQFTSREFQTFLENNAIRHVTSAPFHPSTNGQAERMVRSTKESLHKLGRGDFSQRLADLLLRQHITPHATTGRSPAELLMGRRLTTLLDRLHPDFAPDAKGETEVPDPPRAFQPGDQVYARNYGAGPVWIPATISRTTGPVSYEVANSEGKIYRQHINQLRKRWPPREPERDGNLPPCVTETREVAGAATGSHLGGPGGSHDPLPMTHGAAGAAETTPSIPAGEPATDSEGPTAGSQNTEGLRRSQRVRQPPAFLGDYVWSGAPQA